MNNISNSTSNTIVMGTTGDDSIDSSGDFVSINAGEGNNYISSGNGKNVSINSGAGNDTIIDATYGMGYVGGENININSGAGNDSILNYGDNVTINAGAGDDSIHNSTGYLGDYRLKVSVNGGAGNDYITYYENSAHATTNGGVGNDTIYAGGYNGVIEYASGDGDDIVSDVKTSDLIQITSGSYTTQTSGNDVIINVDDGSMTLKNAFGYTVNIVTVSGGTSTNTETTTLPSGLKYNTNKTQITVGTKFKGDTVDLTEYATTVYGGEGNDTITGGKGADVLYGDEGNNKIKGGNGADTIVGGAGNDTLTGGTGKDVFIYQSGDDLITDYKAGQDSIMIEDEIDSVSVKGSNVIFTIGEGSLTVKGGKNKRITFIDSEGEVISNNKYSKSTKAANFVETDYWFVGDENFTTAETEAVDNLITTKSPANNLTELSVDYTSLKQSDSVYQPTLAANNN